MRALAACGLLAIVAAWLSGCMRCDRADEFESYVDDPTTLDAVRALNDPPAVVVEVTEGPKESGGNMACGHSPVCIILLPVVIEELAFPLHYKNATVKTNGKPSYEAVFRHNGEFVRATAREGDVAREIQFLALQALKRNVVVEVGRAPVDAQGKPGKFVKTRIQSQVDLLTPYTKLLSDPEAPSRATTLVEATRVLRDDAFPLLQARLADPKEPAAVKIEYFQSMCYERPPAFDGAGRAADLMRAFAAGHPPATAALAALECCERGPNPRNAELKLSLSEARPLVEATLRSVCEAPTKEEFLSQTNRLYEWAGNPIRNSASDNPATKAAIRVALDACRPRPRRNYLAFLFDAPLSEDDRAALTMDPELADEVHARLDPNLDADYALLLAALAKADAKHGHNAVVTLWSRSTPPTQAERQRLSELYTQVESVNARAHSLGRLTQGSASERRETETWLRERLARPASGEPGAATGADASQGYLRDRPSDQDVVRHAALAALGSSADEVPLLRYVARYAVCAAAAKSPAAAASADAAPASSTALPPATPAEPERAAICGFEPVTLVDRPKYVGSLDEIARYALYLAGCDTLYHDRVQRVLEAKEPRALCP